jgi:transposase-like protein
VLITLAGGAAVNTEGMREALGMAIGPSEAGSFWTSFRARSCAAACAV